jgi:hypothetical protein
MNYYPPSNNLGFYHGFIASLSVNVVSELGDKTWFIAAVCFKLLNSLNYFLKFRFWQCVIPG